MLSSTHLEAQKFNRHDVDKSICIVYNGRNIKNVPPPFLNVLIIFPTRVLYLVCTIFSLICSISSSANFKRCFSFKNCEVSLTCLNFFLLTGTLFSESLLRTDPRRCVLFSCPSLVDMLFSDTVHISTLSRRRCSCSDVNSEEDTTLIISKSFKIFSWILSF